MGSESRSNPFGRDTMVPAIVRDAYGRALRPGDQLHLQGGMTPLFVVASIAPVVDPTAPPGLMEIIIRSTLKFRCAREVATMEFTRVIEAATEVPPKAEENPT